MEFRILGALEVAAESGAVDLGGARSQSLLAILLVRRGEIVPAEVLVEEVYAGNPPPTATKSLQAHVSRLRKALGGEHRLETVGRGYRLDVRDDEVDVDRFAGRIEHGRSRLAGGDAQAALTAFEEALRLWRGPPFGDLPHQDVLQLERSRLEELRLSCLEDLVDARLVLGRHAEAVGDLESLTRTHPFRERLRTQLMLALYRSGRQAEALDAYQSARSFLVEELGIEPGQRLRELHQAILNQDPQLDAPVPTLGESLTPTEAPAAHPVAAAGSPEGSMPTVSSGRKTVTTLGVRLAICAPDGAPVDPEALGRVIGRVVEEVERSVDRHGGVIETVTPDAVTAVFGLPVVHEDDALRAVRAADEARIALGALVDEVAAERVLTVEFGIGLSTGEVITAAEGSGLRITGEPLSRAPLLGRGAGGGTIVIDETTRRLVRDAVLVQAIDGAGAWSVRSVSTTDRGHVRRLDSPMVGRERERRRLLDAFDQAVGDRTCQLFTVLGAAGVGKSRLVGELLTEVGGQALVARGRCLPYGDGITFWPLLEVTKEALGLADDESSDEVHARLVAILEEETEAEAIAQRIAETTGLAEVATVSEEGLGFAAVRSLFEALARTRPLVVVFDDIHWGEPTFLDLVEHVAETARDAPILLICIARPELLTLRTGWGGGKQNATSVLLEPLSEPECTQLLGHLVGPQQLGAPTASRIAQAAEGNPLFVEEIVSMLIDDGLLVHRGGRWLVTGDIATVRVPPTIQALLAARLDRLEAVERAVLERAAVTGKVFYEGAVRELAPDTLRPLVRDALASLVRKDMIRPDRSGLGERTYRFRHLLIRDAAYDSIPKASRTELHERFGSWLEAASQREAGYEEVVGYHLEQAYRYRRELGRLDDTARALGRAAAERLGSAGRRAFGRSDAPAAANLLARAVALLPADDPLRVDLLPNVRSMQGIGEFSWAERVLTEAVEAAATSGDRRLAANALVQRGFLRLFTDQPVTPAELIDVAHRSIEVFAELDDQVAVARAWRLVAQAHYLDRRLGLCAEASEQAFAHVRTTGERFELREIVEWLVIALLLGPTPAIDATNRCERLLEEVSGEPLLKAQIYGAMAPLLLMQGRSAEADDAMTMARTAMEDAGEWIWIVAFWLAFVHLWRDDPKAAEQELRPGYEALSTIGEKSHYSSFAHGLSQALYLQGRYDECLELTRECELASRPNDVHSQVIWRSIRAKLLARRGEHEAAAALGDEALAIASSSDFLVAHADALADRAEVARLAGDHAVVRRSKAHAVECWRLKGNTFAIDRFAQDDR